MGVAFASLVTVSKAHVWAILGMGVIAIAVSFLKKQAAMAGFCLLFLAVGILRIQIAEFALKNDPVRLLNDKPEKITLVGNLVDEPSIRGSYQNLRVKIYPVKSEDGSSRFMGNSCVPTKNGVAPKTQQFNWVKNTHSIVLVSTARYPEYHYLDTIKVTGYVKTPAIFDEFNYKNYLMKDGIYSVMDFPSVVITSREHHYNPFTFLYERILFLKEHLRKSISSNFSAPQGLIVEGIVLGSTTAMTQDLKNKLNGEGLSHIIAVSGSHIVIITSMVLSLLLFLGLWRAQALRITIIFIWIYILMVGLPPSGVRAVIMSSILLLAQILGRQNTSSRTLVLAGTLMLVQNPFLLMYDIGFQLSFLASLGIIYIKPMFDYMIITIPKILRIHAKASKQKDTVRSKLLQQAKNLVDILSVTFAVQVATLPIIFYNFHTLSFITPVSNFLILPVIPLLMTFGFLSAVLGIFSHFLGWVFFLPAWVLLTYFLNIMDMLYQPWAIVSLGNISWVWFVLYAGVLLIVVCFLQRKLKTKFLEY